ncbi:TRAP transporter large permease [Halomonas alkalicola]|uniref:TRAP transporter large permease protein n=1 Tax=Halomonas alkalicola TaxID=1930622 RepID=A0ABY9H091_9GAMM|nr:TRAP transporter large permease subunit [Halomonas alkalicola]WLI71901.1 TRAP transporter large permease subunit [Halomonas alkalicola]
MSMEQLLVFLMFFCFMVLLLVGLPVAWALAASGFLFAVIGHVLVEYFSADLWFTWAGTIGVMPGRIYSVVANELMVALPLFILMGIVLDCSGVAQRTMSSIVRVMNGMRGSYAITVVIVGILLAASTGIVGASVAMLGLLSLQPMLDAKYNKSLAVGTACSVGTLGILIPPSIMLVIMADRLGTPDASVGKLFMGALIPGLMLGAMYIIYILIASFLDEDLAPAISQKEGFSPKILLDVFIAVIPPLALIFAVLGSIFTGFATTTEASAVGVLGAVLLAMVFGKFSVGMFRKALYQTSRTTAFIFAIFIGATIFASVLRGLGGDDVIRDLIVGLPFGETGVVLSILFLVFLLGFFLDWVEITLIILPLVAPVVFLLGVDPVWFAVLFAICLQTSFLTPPVGFALFYIKGVAPPQISTLDVYKGIVPFLVLQVAALLMVLFFKPLATWLPQHVYGG